MSLGTYVHGTSLLHRAPAGGKVLALLVCGTLILLITDLPVVVGVLLAILVLYAVGRIPVKTLIAQIRPALWVFVILFAFQAYTQDVVFAAAMVLRFAALLLLASLVTLTTPSSAMIDTLERHLRWLKWVGVNPGKVSLGFSLALRFIPVVAQVTRDVREAQRARGLEWSVLAVALPVIIRTLKMSDDIASAIDARGYDP